MRNRWWGETTSASQDIKKGLTAGERTEPWWRKTKKISRMRCYKKEPCRKKP